MIEITVDAASATRFLTELESKQIPFATKTALNTAALAFQTAERAHLRGIFTLRRPEWADRSIKITHFATKAEQWATIAVQPPGASGPQRADILGKFEEDTSKSPRGRTIAVPVSARIKRGNTGVISKRDRPAAYNFRQVGKAIRGDRHTFIIRKADGSGAIFQRTKAGVFALYLLVRQVPIQPDLKFVPTAQQVVTRVWDTEFTKALESALRTAK